MTDSDALAALLGGSIILLLVIGLIAIAVVVLYVIGLWKLFKKAGKNGWEAIVPFYNTYVLVEIAGLNWWYFLIAIAGTIVSWLGIDGLSTITNIAGMVVNFFIFYNLAKKMHKSPTGIAVASIFVAPIMAMVLGFSKNYQYDSSVEVSPNGPVGDKKETEASNSSSERYCLGCGQKLADGVQFCKNCGKKVE